MWKHNPPTPPLPAASEYKTKCLRPGRPTSPVHSILSGILSNALSHHSKQTTLESGTTHLINLVGLRAPSGDGNIACENAKFDVFGSCKRCYRKDLRRLSVTILYDCVLELNTPVVTLKKKAVDKNINETVRIQSHMTRHFSCSCSHFYLPFVDDIISFFQILVNTTWY